MKLLKTFSFAVTAAIVAYGSSATASQLCPQPQVISANAQLLDSVYHYGTSDDAVADLAEASEGDVYSQNSFSALKHSWHLLASMDFISPSSDDERIQLARTAAGSVTDLTATMEFDVPAAKFHETMCFYSPSGQGLFDGTPIAAIYRKGSLLTKMNVKQLIKAQQHH